LKYSLTGEKKTMAYEDTPYGKHGKLSLKKVDGYGNAPVIVDKNGDPFQLRGASTHGMQWFPQYVNQDAFQSLRDEWGVNMVRLVSYVKEYGGYTTGSDCQAVLDGYIEKGVEAATNLGLYVIIDWHVLDFNPNDTIDDAKKFFQKYAEKYKGCDNVIFEICNEPTNVDWYTEGSTNDLYTYCKTISNIIRNDCGNDSIIVCGTNTYSQDVDQVAAKPLANDGFENIMYTFHFYAASHGDDLRNKVRNAVAAGTPIFVTEFGICEYTGDGTVDTTSADTWIKLFDEYNISYTCWSLCNKDESASYFLSTSTKTSGWTEEDLSATAIWLINTNRAHEEKENGTTSSGTEGTESSGSGTETGGSSQETGNSGSASGTEGTGSTGSASGTEGTGSSGSVSGTEGTGTGSTGNVSGTEGTGSTGSVSGTEGTGNTGSASGTEGTGSTGSLGSTGGGGSSSANQGTGGTTTNPTTTPSATTTGSSTVSGSKKVSVRLKKSVIRLKKGKKARIAIKTKAAGDSVKKYTIVGKKNIITVTKKGVVTGRQKGTVRVKVVMKSGASAWCRIVVRR
jgi:endoglucanase